MTEKNDWVAEGTPGHTEADWTYSHTAANSLATQVNTNTATKQPLDGDLTAIAALTPANDDVLQRKSGAWTNRTIAQLSSDLGATSGGAQVPTYVISITGSTVNATPRPGSGFSAYSGSTGGSGPYTVIQNAINALTPSGSNGSGGGTIHICSGVYFLSDELKITGWEGVVGSSSSPNSQLIIEGDGYSTYLVQNTAAKSGIVIKNCASFSLKDFRMYVGSSAAYGIVGLKTGATSEMSCWKANIERVQVFSDSTSSAAVSFTNFFELSIPHITVTATHNTGIEFINDSTTINYGNSQFGYLCIYGAGRAANTTGLVLKSNNTNQFLTLLSFQQVETIFLHYGIYIKGYQNAWFGFLDLEDHDVCFYIDGGSGYETGGVTVDAGYLQPAASGKGINVNAQPCGGHKFTIYIYTGAGSVVPIRDVSQFKPSNKYEVTVVNAADVTACLSNITDLAKQQLRIEAMDGTVYHNLGGAHGLPAKTTPVNADELPILDSAASFGSKRITWANLKAAVNNASRVINVKDYGAVGDGTTDDSAAFTAAFAAAVAGTLSTYTYSGWNRCTHAIYIPAGTYLITANGSLLKDFTPSSSGLKFYGDGQEVSEIVFAPTAANGYLCTNVDDLQELVFEDMTFYGSGANAATATFMKSYSTGHAQNYVFNRITWGGTWKYGFDLTGTNNNSELTWFQCQVQGAWTAFLYAGASSTSDQFLNYDFYKCIVATTTGNFVDLAYGGCVNVWGGSYIHLGNGTDVTSAAQIFFNLGAADVTHFSGIQQLYVAGIRVEHRHQNSQLVHSEWKGGSITFQSCITDSNQNLMTNPTTMVQARFDTAQELPAIVFDSCVLMGKHTYINGSGTYNWASSITYRSCHIMSFSTANAFITTTDEGGGPPGGRPPIRFVDCRPGNNDINEVFDCTVNWQGRINGQVERRVVSMKKPGSGLPGDGWGTTCAVKLPLNAVITRVASFKGAGGGSASTTFTYTLTDADSTVIATAAGVGAAWSAGYSYDSGPLYRVCSTNNKRTLTLTSANIGESATDNMFLIEYLA